MAAPLRTIGSSRFSAFQIIARWMRCHRWDGRRIGILRSGRDASCGIRTTARPPGQNRRAGVRHSKKVSETISDRLDGRWMTRGLVIGSRCRRGAAGMLCRVARLPRFDLDNGGSPYLPSSRFSWPGKPTHFAELSIRRCPTLAQGRVRCYHFPTDVTKDGGFQSTGSR